MIHGSNSRFGFHPPSMAENSDRDSLCRLDRMADEKQSQGAEEPAHRGRVQAQGGGIEKSEPWAQGTPPTESETLARCDRLENQLTTRERKDREQPLTELRRYIRAAARRNGVSAPVHKSFLKRGSKDIRVDLEVIKGMACVPDHGDG